MSDDSDLLPDRERARVRSRDRKVRGPRVVVDNPGLRTLALYLAGRRRRPRPAAPAAPARRRPRR
ncbi:MAG TPA: hypothetical protein VKF59_00835 [Candidatus Dormibacteraeota bacterium]|nr:hypothetical protein [Candidatus Dormibacteraeota bacterium]